MIRVVARELPESIIIHEKRKKLQTAALIIMRTTLFIHIHCHTNYTRNFWFGSVTCFLLSHKGEKRNCSNHD